jgi:hypothetical protein
VSVDAIAGSAIAGAAIAGQAIQGRAVNASSGGFSSYYAALAGQFGYFYSLDDLTASSVAADSVGGIDGSYVGTVTKEQAALSGGEGTSVTFGANGYINADDLRAQLTGSTGSLELTINYPGAGAATRTLFSATTNTNSYQFAVSINTSNLITVQVRKVSGSNTIIFRTDSAISTGTQVIHIKQEGTGVMFYVDGAQVASSIVSQTGTSTAADWWDDVMPSANNCRIGTLVSSGSPVNYIASNVDNIALGNTPLSDDAIAANYALSGV